MNCWERAGLAVRDWGFAVQASRITRPEEPTTPTITIQEAQARLTDLIHRLAPGDEVVITENSQPVAKLVAQAPSPCKPRQRGSARGKLVIHAEDDEHLEDFKEYMPRSRTGFHD